MTVKVYDYDSSAIEIELPVQSTDEILNIFVNIKSGDETGVITLRNGATIMFDASDCRIHSFDDGSYIVENGKIEEWINFEPTGERTASYERQEMFGW